MKLLLFVALFSFVVSVSAQNYDVSITTIQVWVKAIDRDGKPVEGLTASDFEVFESGHKMNITCFEEIKQRALTSATVEPAIETTSAPQPIAAASNPLKVVLLFDLLNTSQAELLYLRSRADDFFTSLRERKIPVMLVALTPTGRLGVLEQFTTDTDRIRMRISRLQANPNRDMRVTNTRREISRVLQLYEGSPTVKMAENLARVAQREEEHEAKAMLDALEAFQSFWTQTYSEHGVVLYASGGVNAEPGKQYYDMIARHRPDMELHGTLALPESNRDLRTRLKNTVHELNRSNLTFYTINTRGAVGVVDNIYEPNARMTNGNNYLYDYQEFQDVLAEETGGLSFRNSMNFQNGLQKILTDINHYYMLCYSAPEKKDTDQYRKIEVRTHKPGVHLRHRTGYLNLK